MTAMTPVKPFLPAVPLLFAYVHRDRPFDAIRCVDPWVRDHDQTLCMNPGIGYPYRIAPCLRVHGRMHELSSSEFAALCAASKALDDLNLGPERNTQ